MDITELVGKTLAAVEGKKGDESIVFRTTEGDEYILYHDQDCCESVCVEDIRGDLADLVSSPILSAEEIVSEDCDPEGVTPSYDDDSFTWTFYRLQTAKGGVVIRWYGTSNGYCSERVTFAKTERAKPENRWPLKPLKVL